MKEFDVIVLGTGAAGMTAAIAAHDGGSRVALFEKAATVGGTSAWSGGQLWTSMHGFWMWMAGQSSACMQPAM